MTHETREKIRFLLRSIRPYKFFVVFLVIGSFIGSAFDTISIGMLIPLLNNFQGLETNENIPKIFQWIAKFLSPYPINTQILLTIGVLVLSFLLKNSFLAVSIKAGYWLSSKLTADLRLQAMNLLMNVGIDFHHKAKAGYLLDKALNNTSQIETLIREAIKFMVNLITFIMLGILLLILSWQLTLISLILGVIMYVLISVYMRKIPVLGDQLATDGREMVSTMQETLSGIHLVKAYSKERNQVSVFAEKAEKVRQNMYKLNFKVHAVHLLTDCLGIVALATFLIVAMIIYNINSTILISRMLPFIYILTRIIPILKCMNTEKAEILRRWPFVRLVYELLRTDNKTIISNGSIAFKELINEIKFKSITFSYLPDKKLALSNVDFSIPAGKTTAIVGSSGSGKSTIVSLLLRFYDPQHGKITIDDTPLDQFDIESYHRRIGIVSQDTFLFHNSVKFNIDFATESRHSDDEIIVAAKKAGAHEFIMDLPNGYDTVLGDRGITLSGGQRQRISIARAILNDPEILILDEATSALDTQTEKLIHQSILDISQNRTVIMIAHRLSTIRNADQIIVLNKGRVVEVGDWEMLKKINGQLTSSEYP